MPSRPIVAFIVAFWIATLGLAFYKDIWPRLMASGPPPIAVDLSDEATQYLPIKWKVLRGDKQIGSLTTKLAYQDADDTFEFTSQYKDLRLDVGKSQLLIPDVTTKTRVARSGSIREQSMTGKLRLGDMFAEAKVEGRNENGLFVGRYEIVSPLPLFNLKSDLAPVPVKDGQALNPLQPVNRIVNIQAGQHWFVHEIDPLGDALAALFKEKIGQGFREALEAKVGASPETLVWGKKREEDACWVISYRGGEASAKTWVRVSDGKVLRQEAALMGDRIALEREE